MKRIFLTIMLFALSYIAHADVVNVYVWGGEIPRSIVQRFESETGIKVNFSTYDSNETMYAKLKASRSTIYDVIMPSGYYVERMLKQDMLTYLDHRYLPNINNIDPFFTKSEYDEGNYYSVPLIWGLTGIFYSANTIHNPPQLWQELWQRRWYKQLMMLDDSREVFALSLMSLGYNPNDRNAKHIHQAYEHLLALVPNIKMFASDGIQSILIDEDASIGAAWNGDAFKAHAENPAIHFIFPQDGFVIWSDCLAIPKNPPHLLAAYRFINYMLRPDIAKQIALIQGHAITNKQGRELLPENIRNNPITYPSPEILKKGYFQRDVGEETLQLYNNYWEQLKLAF